MYEIQIVIARRYDEAISLQRIRNLCMLISSSFMIAERFRVPGSNPGQAWHGMTIIIFNN
ncbi:MAG: hypothetical protein JWO44_2498 [Bacteroidetes bacterium]|nr:hypothetical protein [Bacteroidota bacterium]